MTTATATSTARAHVYIDAQVVRRRHRPHPQGHQPRNAEEVITEIAYGTRAETRRAIEAAAKAMPAWMKSRRLGSGSRFSKKTAELMREPRRTSSHAP